MAPLRVLLVEDEPIARRGLAKQLAALGDVELVGQCGDGLAAIESVRTLQPDLVLLDVQMPGLDGFGVIEAIGVDQMPAVVFVTAFGHHTLRAFDVHAVDYLLKPIDPAKLTRAIDRARRRLAPRGPSPTPQRTGGGLPDCEASGGSPVGTLQRTGGGLPDCEASGGSPVGTLQRTAGGLPDGQTSGGSPVGALTAALTELRRLPAHAERLAVREAGRILVVRTADIDWMSAADNYVELHIGPLTHLLGETLSALEARLDPDRFLRVHRSRMVNIDRVAELRSLPHGEYEIILHDGTRITSARGYRDRLRRLIGGA